MSASTETSADTGGSAANARQVGGDHYKTGGIEHWDLMILWQVPYLIACASKYVARHAKKNGREDLEKAGHYLEKQEKEGYNPHKFPLSTAILEWCESCDIPLLEAIILSKMLCGGQEGIKEARKRLPGLIEKRYPPKTSLGRAFFRGNPLTEENRPGTAEDGGHHARQPVEEEGEVIKHWGDSDVADKVLPTGLSTHEWQHRCNERVQALYWYDASAAGYIIKREYLQLTANA